jgi:cellulose synthase/poly-beta-1,6-N-acetylglucosamine synthase-like glycosyltransferase
MTTLPSFDLETVVTDADELTTAESTEVGLASYIRQHQADVDALPTYRPVIAAIVPAYNEAETIEAVLRSLLKQTRLPDQIHVIVNNTKDDTFELAAKFAGPRTGKKLRKGSKERQVTEVFVHDIGANPDKKVGALNYGFAQVPEADYLLGVDGDTTLARDAVSNLEAETHGSVGSRPSTPSTTPRSVACSVSS